MPPQAVVPQAVGVQVRVPVGPAAVPPVVAKPVQALTTGAAVGVTPQ